MESGHKSAMNEALSFVPNLLKIGPETGFREYSHAADGQSRDRECAPVGGPGGARRSVSLADTERGRKKIRENGRQGEKREAACVPSASPADQAR